MRNKDNRSVVKHEFLVNDMREGSVENTMKFLLLQDTTRTQRMAGTKQSAVSMYRTGSRSWSAAPTLPLHATTMKDVLGYRLVSSPVPGWPFHARFFSVLLRVANFCMREQHRRAAVCGSTPAVPGTARTLADELPTVIRLRCWGSLERRPVVDIPHDRCLTRMQSVAGTAGLILLH